MEPGDLSADKFKDEILFYSVLFLSKIVFDSMNPLIHLSILTSSIRHSWVQNFRLCYQFLASVSGQLLFSNWLSPHDGISPKHLSLRSTIQKGNRWPPFLRSPNMILQKDFVFPGSPALELNHPCGKRMRPWPWPALLDSVCCWTPLTSILCVLLLTEKGKMDF